MIPHQSGPIKKVCIVYKNTFFQNHVVGKKNKKLFDFIKRKHPLTKPIESSHKMHVLAVQKVIQLLLKRGIHPKVSQRTRITSLEGYDLIITIGGDGTLLRTCHHIHNQLVLGINSAPQHSVGALCALVIDQLEKKLDDILQGNFLTKKIQRIRIKINNKHLPVEPINDVLYTSISPAATSRYIISHDRIKEEHKSSGIWIATQTGSSAAINAAGGLKQHPLDIRLQYLIREPYQGTFNPYRLTRGFINRGEQLKIVSKMTRSCLYLDGPTKFFTLDYGDRVALDISNKVLNLVTLT
ncbi:MAG: NAD(+)/NADH kinase [Deltaproteobacteria bacterium]|nr:NAD(+)/NADH kinase [Deltaproteobacteria bacterium]